MKRVEFRGVAKALTPQALAAYEQLRSGEVAAGEMEHLLSLLPAELAETMRQVLTTAKDAEKTVKDAVPALVGRTKPKKAADKAAQDDQQKPEPTEEPKDDDPDPQPSSSGGGDDDPNGEPEEEPEDSSGLPDLDGA